MKKEIKLATVAIRLACGCQVRAWYGDRRAYCPSHGWQSRQGDPQPAPATSRFEVGCSYCPTVDGQYPRKRQAETLAVHLQATRHKACPGKVYVYDRMAHHGHPELWTAEGVCRETRLTARPTAGSRARRSPKPAPATSRSRE